MSSVSLGPLTLATDRLVAVVAMWAFVALLALAGRRMRQPGERIALWALGAGIVAARASYVALHWTDFSADPLSVLAVWQGGFALLAGISAAAFVLLALLRGWRARLAGLSVLGVVALAGLSALDLLALPPRPLPPLAPLARLAGPPLDLAAARGKPLVINLWATWCPPCRRELPMLDRAARTSPVPIVLVDSGEAEGVVRAYLVRYGISPGHVALDPGETIARGVGAQGLPVTLFIDAQGMIVQTHVGEIGQAGLHDGIAMTEKDN